jgi:hypothetical protein
VLETIAGRIEATMANLSEVAGNDRLHVLGMGAEARLARWPAVHTFTEQGVPLLATIWFGLCAPARLPEAIAERLHRETLGFVAQPEMNTAGEPRLSASATPVAARGRCLPRGRGRTLPAPARIDSMFLFCNVISGSRAAGSMFTIDGFALAAARRGLRADRPKPAACRDCGKPRLTRDKRGLAEAAFCYAE